MSAREVAPRGLAALLDRLPFLGSLRCSHAELAAGAVEELRFLYEVGASGLADSGRLKLTFKFYSDWGELQTHDALGRDYVSARFLPRASLPGESPPTLQRLGVKFDPKGHERPYQKAVLVDLIDGYARPGDQIEVRLGDRAHGGPGTRAQTFVEDSFKLRAYVDVTGTSRLAAVPGEIRLRIVPAAPQALRVITPRLGSPGAPLPVYVRLDDAWGNPVPSAGARVTLSLSDAREQVARVLRDWTAGTRALRHELTLELEGDYLLRVDVQSESQTWTATVPLSIRDAAAPRAFFADLHVHAHDTVGTNSTAANLHFARDLAGLDVLGYTVNDFQITDSDWASALLDLAQYQDDGHFVCFPGTEWCGNSAVGGDHNVVFLGDEVRFPRDGEGRSLRSFEWHEHMRGAAPEPGRWPLSALYAAYADAPERFLLVPHVGGRRASLDWHHPELERLCELASSWGHFAWLYEEALQRGYRLGASASGDEHRGRPGGGAPGASIFGVQGGLTGVRSPGLTRADIGRALRQRHTWATTGQRNVALLSCAGYQQGDELAAASPFRVQYALFGHGGWEYAALHDAHGAVWSGELDRELGYAADRVRVRWGGARVRDRYRWANWALEVSVRGASVLAWTARGFEHPEEQVTLLPDGRLSIVSATHGDADQLELQLSALTGARISIRATISDFERRPWLSPARFEVSSEELFAEGSVRIELGGEGLFLAVERLTDQPLPLLLEGDVLVNAREATGGVYPLYLFARERGDAKVWTSPLFIQTPA